MKHGKRPTRAQKIKLQKYKLNPDNWLVIKDYNNTFIIKNRCTDKVRVLERGVVNK